MNRWIEQATRAGPERLFIRSPSGRRLTYRDLDERSARFAAVLGQYGVVACDRVAVRLPKSIECVLLYVACLRLGAVFVPINGASSPAEVEHVLRDAAPRLAVIDAADVAAIARIAARCGVERVATLAEEERGSFAAAAAALPGGAEPEVFAAQPDALAALVYTSGTTGRPKGAMLTHGNLASNAETLAAEWRFTAEDVLLHVLPLHHVHGLFVAINTVLASRASILFVPKFEASVAVRQLAECTVFMGVPTHYIRLLQEPKLDGAAAAHMRLFVSGSAPLPADTQRQFASRTGHEILERYGMTETLMNTSNPYRGQRLPGSVGRALPGVEVRITDARSGTLATEPNTIGMLEVRGPNVFAGYWRDPERTQAEFSADGWFRTGDLGRVDAEGYVHIVGRAKDLVITGGYNVYPAEVESELDALPGVLESAVFGVPHRDLGEGVTALVVPAPAMRSSEAELLRALKARLASYKVPKRILFASELPRNAMGKVSKAALRQEYAELYL